MATLFRVKPISQLTGEVEHGEQRLKRTLGPVQLTSLGIGAIIGAGIFSTVGPGLYNSFTLLPRRMDRMPKKSKKKQDHRLLIIIGGLLLLVIVWAVVSAFFDLIYTFMTEHPGVYLIIPAVAAIALVLYYLDRKKQKAEQEKRLQQEKEMRGQDLQLMLSHREAERKTQEDTRAQAILAHRAEWGDDMCQWMIDHRINPHKPETINIMNRYRDWGRDNCQRLLQQKVEAGMTEDMVQAAYGKPPVIDERESTARDERYRYVYGRPRRDATYIWFKNGVVTRIKQ